ncbi:hypothetical protein [Longimicrobium terrae]|uniref:Porin n=1 Tax=Longimicrobium terrae TaxID=1639882 RepID=A0A841H7A0_9BACT|nr:hypothetical protein [Longimicrobium terrae]MBB4639419.1 hypothetical protein [Longimicrobium terrae]MBB6073726.1 hypothetical protein [Longimicrobium terrae]NNC30668.1 hypothetical protein [Longimicrobium terrae]
MPGTLRRTLFALLLATLPATAAAQGITVMGPDSSRLTFNGRVQTIFNTTSVDGVPQGEMALRRVRLEATLRLSDLVSARIQPEYAGSRVVLKDAFVRLAIHPALNVWAGQAFRPFGAIAQTTSVRIPPIERGVRVRGVSNAYDEYNLIFDLNYSERDVGLQIRGEPKGAPLGLTYAAGWFNGPARAEFPNANTGQVAARIGIAPRRWMRMNVGYSGRDFGQRDTSVAGDVRVLRGAAWEADLELGTDAHGPHALFEAVAGDFDPFAGARFHGAQAWLSYRGGRVSHRVSGVEPLLRVSHGDPDTGDDLDDDAGPHGGTLVTPGVNLWLGGLNRVTLNYDVWAPRGGENAHGLKAMFQLAF